MKPTSPWVRALFPLGLACVVVGTLDPLEGSLLILPGFGLIAIDSIVRHGRFRRVLNWAFALVAFGVAALWIVSSLGGLRMGSGVGGLDPWWGLLIVPYPIGWLAGIIGVGRTVADRRRQGAGPAPIG